VATTTIRHRFDCHSTTTQRPRSPWLRLAGYITVYLMTFDKQPNARRTSVESKSNRSCDFNSRLKQSTSIWTARIRRSNCVRLAHTDTFGTQ